MLRGWFLRTKYQSVRKAVEVIQRYTRCHLRRKQIEKQKLIQTRLRTPQPEQTQSALKCDITKPLPTPQQQQKQPERQQSWFDSFHSQVYTAWFGNQSTSRRPMTHSCHVTAYGTVGRTLSPLALWETLAPMALERSDFAAKDLEATSRQVYTDFPGIASVRKIGEVLIWQKSCCV